MAKPELGEKRVCGNCSAKFYDLGRDPIVCPKCGTVYEIVQEAARPTPRKAPVAKPAPVAETEDDDEDDVADGGPEIVSLEDAEEDDGTTVDGDEPDDVADVDVDVEDDDDDADDPFIEDDDDEDDDVSDIIPVKKDDDET